ncbi:MAG: phosphoesterase [Labilithrix sp.]|nr:phosphoesterase [Labilithrix sp.]
MPRLLTSVPVLLGAAATLFAIGWRARGKQFLPFDRDVLPYLGGNATASEHVCWIAQPNRMVISAAVVAAAVPGLALPDRARIVAAPLLAAGIGNVAKRLAPRERPNMHRFEPNGGQSYPSTHTGSAAAFGLACAGVARRYGYGRWTYALALGFAGWVGMERIRGAAHWPTDVIGGMALGLGAAGAALQGA